MDQHGPLQASAGGIWSWLQMPPNRLPIKGVTRAYNFLYLFILIEFYYDYCRLWCCVDFLWHSNYYNYRLWTAHHHHHDYHHYHHHHDHYYYVHGYYDYLLLSTINAYPESDTQMPWSIFANGHSKATIEHHFGHNWQLNQTQCEIMDIFNT